MPQPPLESYRIGELAARTGRSVHAIRWYEAQGLLPGVARDAAGRRVYNERHQGWLELMERLRTTGMTVAQMRTYTGLVMQGKATLAQRQQLLAAHRAHIAASLAQWQQAQALIDSKIEFYGQWMASGQRPQLVRPKPAPKAAAPVAKPEVPPGK